MTQHTPHFSSAHQTIPGVKNLIAVGSGKGGVGKSTVAVNLASALSAQNMRVGILDADIYGPNQPHMCGVQKKPDLVDNRFKPIEAHGLFIMSLGFLIEDETPLVWRGPMVSKMLQQLLYQTAWPNIDVLIIDLPPGTGDVQLTLSKKAPLDGAIIVTTPQHVATQDAQKGLAMFQKIEVPILGVVENMSQHICSQCGHTEPLFGTQGGENMAQHFQVPLLAQLPLKQQLRESCDNGAPYVATYPDSDITSQFLAIAKTVQTHLLNKNRSTFPNIVVE